MEYATLIVGCGLIGLLIAKAWQAGGQGPAPDVVSARVVGPASPQSPAELLAAYNRATREEAERRALEREHERIIETQSQAVPLPWAASPPKAPDPPKP